MIYKEEIDQLATKLESFRNTFICGKTGCGKTSIVKTYLERLNNQAGLSKYPVCILEVGDKYLNYDVTTYISLRHYNYDFAYIDLIDLISRFCHENKEQKEIIFDNFDLLFEPNYRNFDHFANLLTDIMNDKNSRVILITQRINWKMMPFIDQCENLYLGEPQNINEMVKYRNFTRNLDFTNKNFEVIGKYV